MCTLLYQPWPQGAGGGYGALLGLNRDEFYARPAAPPRWWPPEPADAPIGDLMAAGFVAPVDLRAGGTWFGLAETGLFVAITNGRAKDWPLPFRHERSRGELVTGSLRLGRIDAAVADLAAREAASYAPCHLFLAQGDRAAYVVPSDGDYGFAVRWLEAAPHTLTNSGLDKGDTPDFALRPDQPVTPESEIDALRGALATHEGETARCRHGTDRGTRSSAVVFLGPDLERSRLFYADGPPCTTPYFETSTLHGWP